MRALPDRVPVYNLTVADNHEYFAAGVLVHNCDAARYAVAHVDQLGRQKPIDADGWRQILSYDD